MKDAHQLTDQELAERIEEHPRITWWLGMTPNHPEFAPRVGVATSSTTSAANTGLAKPTLRSLSVTTQQPASTSSAIQEKEVISIAVTYPIGRKFEVRRSLRVPVYLSFEDFRDRVCANMDINPKTAELGYRIGPERGAVLTLSNEEEFEEGKEMYLAKVRRAKSEPTFDVENLLMLKITSTSTSWAREPSERSSSTSDFFKHLPMLRSYTYCRSHSTGYCWVDPKNYQHTPQTREDLIRWAKAIQLKETDYNRPPDRNRRSNRSRSQAHSQVREPLSSQGGSRQVNIRRPSPSAIATASKTIEEVDSTHDNLDLIAYPLIYDHLLKLTLSAPQSEYLSYERTLQKHGINYVNNIRGLPNKFFVEKIGMPEGSVQPMLDYFERVAKQAEREGAGENTGASSNTNKRSSNL